MAVYGSQLHQGKSEDEALDAVKTVLEKTIVQPGSARDALAAFTQGEGDVLLAYENEAIKAQEEGEDVDYVVPPSTIRIETPIAVTKDAPESAQAFLDYIWSDEGQQIWADNGYRPVNQELLDEQIFPVPAGPLRHRRVRRLGDGHRRVLRRGDRQGRRDREGARGSHRVADGRSPGNRRGSAPGRHAPARGRCRPGPRAGRPLLSA